MNVAKMRNRVVRTICRRLILDALHQGYSVKVLDGQDCFGPFTKCKEVLEVMFSVDDETLLFFKDGKKVGWVYLIYSNGCDVISDHADNNAIRNVVEGAMNLADKYA